LKTLNLIKEQDEALDELHNREINNELETQNPMLKNMDSQMDKVNSKMKKAQKKLESYVEKSSNTCLMTIICVEILFFLLLISVF